MKKQLMNSFIILTILAIYSFAGCSSNTNNPVNPTVKIDSLTPTSGYIGDIIMISGSYFGTTQTTSFVSFNNTNATEYPSWSNTIIKVKVPAGATSGKVSVTVNGTKSNEINFTVLTSSVVYDTIKIGTQVWMLKNLDIDHYRNGDIIPQVQDPTEWSNLTTGAWCYYNNYPTNDSTYGKLYNWYAVNDTRGLAPVGWHIPTDAEWQTLSTYLGGDNVSGAKLKETGTAHWLDPNTGATNESGFTGLPGGYKDLNGYFYNIKYGGYWWTSTGYNSTNVWYMLLYFEDVTTTKLNFDKGYGLSVRCVKDN